LFRTAILAALIGGSAVAAAFVAWRSTSQPLGTVAHLHETVAQSASAKNLISSPGGGGAAKENVSATAAEGPVPNTAPVAVTSANGDPAKQAFSVAGIDSIIATGEYFLRFPNVAVQLRNAALTRTTASQAIAMLCHVRRSAGGNSLTADLAGTDRRMSPTELENCKRNHVGVTELRAGFEAVVLVRSKLYGAPSLTARDIFLALAAKVPDLPDRPWVLIDNPYRVWNAINPALPAEKIEIWGPSSASPTATLFRRTVMEAGCLSFPPLAAIKEKDPQAFDKRCNTLRDDGIYQRFTEGDNALGSRLDTYPNAIALLDYREAMERPSFVPASIDGVEPTARTIFGATYIGSRPLYLYVNSGRAAYTPYLHEFVMGFERAALQRTQDAGLALEPEQVQGEMRNAMTLPQLNP
jgi:ABC-type phosphate transport system substrate-binding protein